MLSLLARHPWALRPLVVDPFRELSLAQVAGAQATFDQVQPPVPHLLWDIRLWSLKA